MLDPSGHPIALLLAALAICLTSWILKRFIYRHDRRELPSPPGIPFLGHLPYAGGNLFSVKCMEWAKKYGSVFRIHLGAASLVILNDIKSVKQYYGRKELHYRPSTFLLRATNVLGVATMNGQLWSDNRRFCMNALHNLGYGKELMEKYVTDEVQYLVDMLSKEKGRPIQFRDYIAPSVMNIITMFVFGERYPFEDPRRKFWDENLARYVAVMESGTWIDILPGYVKWIAAFFSTARRREILSTAKILNDYTSIEIKKHRDTLKQDRRWGVIDYYLEKIDNSQGTPNTSFTESYLLGNVLSFLIAGTVSVTSNIHWHMLNCAHNVDDLQNKIQKEIDLVIGSDRAPSWDDHHRMPFTMAVVLEMLRLKPTTTLPRGTAEDIVVEEYFIPKATMVLRNTWALNMSPDLWKDPEKFEPTRFLKEDGSELLAKPEYFIPFSYGKRMCPGEALGMMQLFLYLTTLLQKFRIIKQKGESFGFLYPEKQRTQMLQQKLVFIQR